MVFVLAEEGTVRADTHVVAGLALQLEWLLMLCAISCQLLLFLLFLIVIIHLFHIFEHVNDADVLRHVLNDPLPNDNLARTLHTDKHLPVRLDGKLAGDALFAEGVSAFGDDPRHAIV